MEAYVLQFRRVRKCSGAFGSLVGLVTLYCKHDSLVKFAAQRSAERATYLERNPRFAAEKRCQILIRLR